MSNSGLPRKCRTDIAAGWTEQQEELKSRKQCDCEGNAPQLTDPVIFAFFLHRARRGSFSCCWPHLYIMHLASPQFDHLTLLSHQKQKEKQDEIVGAVGKKVFHQKRCLGLCTTRPSFAWLRPREKRCLRGEGLPRWIVHVCHHLFPSASSIHDA